MTHEPTSIDILAGFREVWTATHGRAGRYHVALDGEPAAACSPAHTLKGGARWIVLGDLMDASDVPEHMRCQRPACRKRWPQPSPPTPATAGRSRR